MKVWKESKIVEIGGEDFFSIRYLIQFVKICESFDQIVKNITKFLSCSRKDF